MMLQLHGPTAAQLRWLGKTVRLKKVAAAQDWTANGRIVPRPGDTYVVSLSHSTRPDELYLESQEEVPDQGDVSNVLVLRPGESWEDLIEEVPVGIPRSPCVVCHG